MRLRAFRSFLLPVLFAIALSPPRPSPESPSDAELEALNQRAFALYNVANYAEAPPEPSRGKL